MHKTLFDGRLTVPSCNIHQDAIMGLPHCILSCQKHSSDQTMKYDLTLHAFMRTHEDPATIDSTSFKAISCYQQQQTFKVWQS